MNETWLETFSGEKFYLFYPEKSKVCLVDIAHALSQLCRYNGHTSHFYSVAEHSIHVAQHLEDEGFSPEIALAGLMHDAAEAYVGDIISPIKAQFPVLESMEQKIQNEILKQLCPDILDVHKHYKTLISKIDKNIVNDERKALMLKTQHKWIFNGAEALNCPIPCWTSDDACQRFHTRFTQLYGVITDQEQKYFING